jgi:protein ImuB
MTGTGGPRIAALNDAAEAAGLSPGETLADARAKAGFLQVRAIDTAADDAALRRLVLWATRYTPTASPWDEENGADGFFLEVEGSAHLFGGEENLITDLAARLQKNFGLPARLAVAGTLGAAWALTRFHAATFCILPSGQEAEALAPLPVEALRLAPDICTTLRRLGFKSVGALLDKPRAPFAARFSAKLLRRLDQALGRVDEPLVPVVPPPVYHSLRYLIEPIITQEAVVTLARRLMQTLAHVLVRDDVGARTLKLSLYRVDGEVKTLEIGLTLPTRNAAHVARLIELKLDAAAATDDAGFGFEAIGLAITRAEPMPAQQMKLPSAEGDADRTEQCAALIDALRQRLGPQRVRRFAVVASHLPERAEVVLPIDGEVLQSPSPERGKSRAQRVGAKRRPMASSGHRAGVNSGDMNPPRLASLHSQCEASASSRTVAEGRLCPPLSEGEYEQPRPLLLLPRAEPAEDVAALVPDGPPRRFSWRGVTYEVAGAEGPERIAAEWWRKPHLPARPRDPPTLASTSYGGLESAEAHYAKAEGGDPNLDSRLRRNERHHLLTRDYYLVEDAVGHRFWLFREGLYGRETTSTRWFVHGLFA